MFEKFGEFDSVEELNKLAAEKKEAGDEDALVELAKENGIDVEDAEDYMDDCINTLATPLSAAVGKLKVESEALKLAGILKDWVGELNGLCVEDPELAVAVRRKGKSLAGYMAALVDAGWKNRTAVDKQIVNMTTEVKKIMGSHQLQIGMPDKKTRVQIAREYYVGKQVAE